MTAQPAWYPSPPMALEHEWTDWRDIALIWMARQTSEWTADDLRAAMPECRSNWPGAAVNTASRRGLIVDAGRMIHSISPTRKKSRLPVWRTVIPKERTP
ncbi:hypothetical protein CITRIK5_30037 [Citricoccus sp. K5]|nr:hypothetical protein CITRIK5_30037 [Citricoccus sp. K5]